MKIIRNLNETSIEKVKALYDEAFKDDLTYRDDLFKSYLNKSHFFGVIDEQNNNELVMMTFFNPKRILYLDQKLMGALIFAVAVKKEYQQKGYMKKYLNSFIEDMKFCVDMIFIQAYDWNIYKSFDFLECTSKSEWILRKDQFLKYDNIKEKIDYELINKINIGFINENNIENFIYKTEKENKKYLKLYLQCQCDIIMTNKSYVVYDKVNKKILEYAYLDLRDFIKLVSSLPYETIISSYLDFDKRFFVQKKANFPFTKSLKNKIFDGTQKIYFLDNW